MTHSTLKVQLEASGLSESQLPTSPDQWRRFLDAISQHYTDLQLMAPARQYADDVLRGLIEDIAVGIMLLGPNTEILLANQAALDMFALSEEAVLGQRVSDSIWTVVHDDGTPFPLTEQPVAHAVATLQPVRDVVLGIYRPHRDDWVWVVIDAVPYVENGCVSQVIATLTNITALKEKERALQRNEATTRALLNAVPDMMIRCSGEGHYLEIRPFVHIELLHPIEWYRGRHVSEIVPPDISAKFLDCIRQTLAGGRVEVIEYPLALYGKLCHYEARMAASGPDEVLVMVRDITERKQAEQALRASNERYQLVVDNVREVIYQTDYAGNFTFLNPAWVQFTGFALEESLGRPAREFTHPEDLPLATEERRRLFQRDRDYSRYRLRLLTKDGSSRLVEILAQARFDDEGYPLGTTGTLIDLSDRLQAEQQALELKLKERTVEALKSFLSGVSHDLRTPLSVMNTSLYLLRRKLGETVTDLHYLDTLEVQAAHLARLVDDMVDMSRLDEATVHYEFIRVDLNGLIRDVLYSVRPMAEDKPVLLTYQPGADVRPIRADQVMIGRVVRHLVHNAIQYTPAKGAVTIRTRMDRDQVMLEVSDTGIGITQEDLPYIFDRFFRGDRSRPSGIGGTGLGLSIVRRVVEAHQGSVHVLSRPGEGSTFTVRLPALQLVPRDPAT